MNNKIILFKLKPYKQGEQPFFKKNIKFNTNENPYNTTINCLKEIIKEIKFFGNIFKFYPDPNSIIIKKQIENIYNIKKDNIFVGNGSDDVLSNIFLTFFKKKTLYLIDITYSFYESFIKLFKIKYKIIRINKRFLINIKFIKNKNSNIIINNPNAPTAKHLKNIFIKLLLRNIKSLIVIDETYIEFNKKKNFKKIIKKYKNLIIVQTFSKSKALAGLRIGFSISNKKIIYKMNITKNSLNSYPINIVSQIALKNIFKYNFYFKKNIKKIIKNKIYLIRELKKINFKTLKSETNFILTTNKKLNLNKLLHFLNKKNIFVRKFEIPKIENYLRITVGKIKECKILIKNIKNFTKP